MPTPATTPVTMLLLHSALQGSGNCTTHAQSGRLVMKINQYVSCLTPRCDHETWQKSVGRCTLRRNKEAAAPDHVRKELYMIPSHKRSAVSETSPARQENGAPSIRRGIAETVRGWLSALYLPSEAPQRNEKHQPNEADEIRLHGLGVRW